MLAHLDIHEMTLNLDEPDFETVATGMISIFPFFEYFKGTEGNLDWEEISKRIMELQKIHVSWVSELLFLVHLLHSRITDGRIVSHICTYAR